MLVSSSSSSCKMTFVTHNHIVVFCLFGIHGTYCNYYKLTFHLLTQLDTLRFCEHNENVTLAWVVVSSLKY